MSSHTIVYAGFTSFQLCILLWIWWHGVIRAMTRVRFIKMIIKKVQRIIRDHAVHVITDLWYVFLMQAQWTEIFREFPLLKIPLQTPRFRGRLASHSWIAGCGSWRRPTATAKTISMMLHTASLTLFILRSVDWMRLPAISTSVRSWRSTSALGSAWMTVGGFAHIPYDRSGSDLEFADSVHVCKGMSLCCV